MKRKLMKTIALMISLFLILSCFAGCGKGDNGAAGKLESTLNLNGDKVYPIECEDTLTYWMGTSTNWTHKYENFGETPLGKAIAEATGVKVLYIHPAQGQGDEQIQLLMASDELPHLVQHAWNNYPGGPDVAIKDEYIINLNDVIASYAPALSKVLADNPERDRQVKSDSGAYYAFPFMLEEGILQVAYGPILRSDILKETGLSLPKTIDEWEKVLTAFKEAGVESPWIGDLTTTVKAFAPGYGVYVDWYKIGDKVVYGYAQPEMKEVLKKLNDWYNKGLIDKDIAAVDDVHTKILNGKAGATLAWAGSGMGTMLNSEPDRSKFDIAGVQYPAMKSGENSMFGHTSNIVSMSSGVAISGNCENVELAARFLDYGYTEEGHNLFNFGIEGESYNWIEKDGEKYPQYTELILNNPDGLPIAHAMGLYMRSCYNGIMMQDTRYMEQYYPTTQQKEAQIEWLKTDMKDHILPQLYVSEEHSERDADIMVNVKTYVDEMYIKFITGVEPIEKFDAFIEQLKAFGIDDATAFRQEAYERYQSR